MLVDLKNFYDYITIMFPYTDEENAWISGNKTGITKDSYERNSLFTSIIVALSVAIFSTLIPPLIYFTRFNLL